jgi:hypothetical protein
MKYLFIILTVFCTTANAQVNLDKSYNSKTGNTLYFDVTDQNVVWAIPRFLEAKSSNEILTVGKEIRVRYTVSLPEKTIVDLVPEAGSTLNFRAFRATESKLEQTIDIDPKFKPTIVPLGDINMFGESIPYSLNLDAKHYPNGARYVAKHLFDGKIGYVLGRIAYYFSASRSGQLYQAQSTVAILVPKKKQIKTNMFAVDFKIDALEDAAFSPEIQYNSQTACWGKALENVICLKD